MVDQMPLPGPVVAGGVGGSGTRLIAEMLMALDTYIGSDLNRSLDNQWMTVLLRRSHWYARCHPGQPETITNAIRVLERLMLRRAALSTADKLMLLKAVLDHSFGRNIPAQARFLTMIWAMRRIPGLFFQHDINPAHYKRWGWKEPNSHVYLPYLNDSFPGLQYIHVIRHGLDMAFSSNLNQLRIWGREYLAQHNELPRAALAYWIDANSKAVTFGAAHMPDRFLLLNFDALCADPEPHILRLLDFLDIDRAAYDLEKLCALPQIPPSTGRYKRYDLSVFTPEQLTAVEQFGFAVDTN